MAARMPFYLELFERPNKPPPPDDPPIILHLALRTSDVDA